MDDETSATRVGGERPGTCPHVDRNDPRCATRFSLGLLCEVKNGPIANLLIRIFRAYFGLRYTAWTATQTLRKTSLCRLS